MVGVDGLEPSTNQLCVPLQLSLPLSGLRSGLSLHPRGTPAIQSLHLSGKYRTWLGIAIAQNEKASPNLTGYTYRLLDKQP